MSLGITLGLLRSQTIVKLPLPTKNAASGQTIIVTGANTGLGREAARHFVKLGAGTVIIACRTVSKGEDAKKDIETTTGRTGVVEVWELNLSSYASVEAFAARAQQLPRLDALLENAGVYTYKWEITEDNESSITTNVVSTFLLALLLVPKLRESANKFGITPRLTIVSSFVQHLTIFRDRNAEDIFAKLNTEKDADMNDRYNDSKILEVFVIRELAALLTASSKQGDIIVNCLNPGFCVSELTTRGQYTAIQTKLLAPIKAMLARTTEEGSRTLVHATLAGKETHGQYLDDCKIGTVSTIVSGKEGPALQKKIWAELLAKLERIHPHIGQNM